MTEKYMRIERPLVVFFVLAYGISWGTFYVLGGPYLFPFGPFLAALITAGLSDGWDGLKDLGRRCLDWRVNPVWYVVALGVPALIAFSIVGLHLALGASAPAEGLVGSWLSLLLLFPAALVDAPLGEETGWRGFALPRFARDRSPLANTLILGVLIAGWHLPIALSGGALAVPYVLGAIASAVVTNWVYYNAHESALLAMIYHTSANAIGMHLFSRFPESEQVSLYWLLAAVNGAVAVALVVATRGTLGVKSES
jgi:membrane protease YdiL (CAAX protease family)